MAGTIRFFVTYVLHTSAGRLRHPILVRLGGLTLCKLKPVYRSFQIRSCFARSCSFDSKKEIMRSEMGLAIQWSFQRRRGTRGNRSATGNAGPDFLCVGAHKAGTTWLYRQLDSHPDFWMPPVKELHYFDQLSRVQRASRPRCRDERDLRFLERLESLSAETEIDLDNYARLFE